VNILVNGMQGLGDTIYQRPFIKSLANKYAKVYVETAWPELLEDIDNIYFVKSETRLRTQSKNVASQDQSRWVSKPSGLKTITIRYGHKEMRTMSIPEAMKSYFYTNPVEWDLPVYEKSPVIGKYAVIRPVTARSEWPNVARNCHSDYIKQASLLLKEAGYTVVSIADLEYGKEVLIGDEPYSDVKFHNGELSVKEIIALVNEACVVVSAVGFMAPMTMALGIPYICILGGMGGHNRPDRISSDTLPNNNKISWIEPDNFCMCTDMKHECDKTISNFEKVFKEELKWVTR
jgi:ADP-heptose:LPS heptosyltransferase